LAHPNDSILKLLLKNFYFDYLVDTCATIKFQNGKIDILILLIKYRMTRVLAIVHGETKTDDLFFVKILRMTLDSLFYLNY
jgi:hypothetical protein